MVSIFIESGLGASRKDTDSAKTFLAEQIKTFEAKLEESEARLKEFRLRNIGAQGADGKDAASRMAEVNEQLNAARLELREAENARDAAKQQLAADRTRLAGGQGAVADSSPALATPEVDARLDAQKRGLDTLLQRYTDQHPDVVSTRRLIRELEEQKKREVAELRRMASASGGSPAPASMAAQELARMLATAEVQVASLRARVSEYSARYTAARESLKLAPQIEAEAAQLNRDYAITKKNYEDLVARRQAAVMSGELDVASGVAEFRLIDPPRVSPQPVSPNRFALLPVVLLVSLGAAAGFAFVATQLRPTFSDAEQLRQFTGMPLLGVVTMLTSDEDRQRQRASLFRFVAASGGLVGLFVAGMVAMTLTSRYAS
jgi:polysaccharide chain length determinant protein (PEP-CTERM system associated)